MLRAPDGHRPTWCTIAAESAAMMSIHGRRFTSNTSGRPRTQRPEWMQSEAFQTTVISPFEYSLISSLMPLSYS